MAGVSVDISFDKAESQNRLADIVERLSDRRGFYEDVGNLLMDSTAQRFIDQKDPAGRPWRPLKPGTIKARMRNGQTPITILRSNSKHRAGTPLAGSINMAASDDDLRIGSPVAYAAIHQLGGTIDKPARQAKIYRMADKDGKVGRRFVPKAEANHVTDVTIPAHKITIPARPYIGISALDQTRIQEQAEVWLTL